MKHPADSLPWLRRFGGRTPACTILCLLWAASAVAGDWSTAFSVPPGTYGVVNAAAADKDGNVYVGGSFTKVEDLTVNNVAMWNPKTATWSALDDGGGSVGVSSGVKAMTFDSSGNLYLAGSFTVAGKTTVNRVVKWDPVGKKWYPLLAAGDATGTTCGTAAAIGALAWFGGKLYMGGSFLKAGGVAANRIAAYDPDKKAWSILGTAAANGVTTTSTTLPYINALAADDTGVYVGGWFQNVGGSVKALNMAKWTGTKWSALGSGLDNEVKALTWTGTRLYAGGKFTTSPTTPTATPLNYIGCWDGTTWLALAADTSAGAVKGVGGVAGYDYYVTSLATATVPGQTAGTTAKVVLVGGYFTTAVGKTIYRVARLDNTDYGGTSKMPSWSTLTASNIASPSVNGVIGAPLAILPAPDSGTSGKIYLGGDLVSCGGLTMQGIVLWEGGTFDATNAKWSGSWKKTVRAGQAGGTFTNGALTLSRIGDGKILVGGGFTSISYGRVYRAALLDASTPSWYSLAVGDTFGLANGYVYASSMDGSGGLYVAGTFADAGPTTSVNNIARWSTGTGSWSALGSATCGVTGTAYALALDSSKNLYVGGSLTAAGTTTTVNNIALYNSTANTWSPLTDTGSNVGVGDAMSAINALALNSSGKLYVGGSFAKAGGISANNIALWDPTARTWSALGSGTDNGVSGFVNAMVLDSSGNLYVAGSFSTAGGKRVNSIAKWNGTTWSALGAGDYPGANSGVLSSGGSAGTINALAFDSNGKLYVGGLFSYAGGTLVNSVAVWDGSVWCALTTPSGIVGVSGTTPNVYALAQAANGGMYLGGYFTLPGGSRFGQWVTDQDDISLSATSVPENSAAGTVVGTLTTKGAASAVYTLSGTDAGKFTISGHQLKVAANAGFDFEGTQLTYTITVTSGGTPKNFGPWTWGDQPRNQTFEMN